MSAAVKKFVVSTFALGCFALLPSQSSALCNIGLVWVDLDGNVYIPAPGTTGHPDAAGNWRYDWICNESGPTKPPEPTGEWCDAHPGHPRCRNRDKEEPTCPQGEVLGPDGACGCPVGEVPGQDGKCTKDPGCGDTESNTLGALATKMSDDRCTNTPTQTPTQTPTPTQQSSTTTPQVRVFMYWDQPTWGECVTGGLGAAQSFITGKAATAADYALGWAGAAATYAASTLPVGRHGAPLATAVGSSVGAALGRATAFGAPGSAFAGSVTGSAMGTTLIWGSAALVVGGGFYAIGTMSYCGLR